MKIDHINISAPMELLEKVKQFYCDVFGMQTEFRSNFSRKGYWLYAEGKALIHLMESDEHYKNEKQGYLDHVAFRVDSIKPIIETLKSLDVKYSSNELSEINMTQTFFRDPAGVKVEVNVAK